MKKPKNEVTYRKLSELKKLESNPRAIKDESFKQLVQSIKENPEYFEARPAILSDRTGEFVIIAGNQRYDAAEFLKLKEIPTVLLSGLTEEKEREIIIRDNVANGEWDFDILAAEWTADELKGWGVPVPDNWGEPPEPEKNPFDDKGITAENKFGIIVECANAKEQEAIFGELQGQGYKCKILVV